MPLQVNIVTIINVKMLYYNKKNDIEKMNNKKLNSTIILSVIVTLFMWTVNLKAQPWNRDVVTGGASYISFLAFDNAIVYAATWGSGVYYSIDKGVSWKPMNEGLTNKYIYTLIVVGKSLLAGTEGGGIYKCNKRKKVWKKSSAGLEGKVVFSLAEKKGVFIAATWQEGLFRSNDRGTSWGKSSEGLENSVIYTVSSSKNSFYAGASKNGVYHSMDDGATWENIGLTGMSVLCIYCLDTIVLFGTWKSGVFRFNEDTNEWKKVSVASGESVKSVAYNKREGVLYCAKRMMGIYQSDDFGETWHYRGLAGYDVFSIAALYDRIIAGTWGNGIFTFEDGDTAWVNTSKTLDAIKIPGKERTIDNIKAETYKKDSITHRRPLKARLPDTYGLSKSLITSVQTCFSGRLVVCYKIKNDGKVWLSLYDCLGGIKKKKVAVVQGGKVQRASFCTEELKNGIYFITLRTSIDRETIKVVYIK